MPPSGQGSTGRNLVPIVLGGPWNLPGNCFFWETRLDGVLDPSRGCGVSDGVRVRGGVLEHIRKNGSGWEVPHKLTRNVADGGQLSLHAPASFVPTPDTIPEGCFVKTPEGVHRACATCKSFTGGTGCTSGNPCNNLDNQQGMMNRYWCPKPDVKPETKRVDEEWVPGVGKWAWFIGCSGSSRGGAAVHITSPSDESTRDWTADFAGGPENHVFKTEWLRPIRVGDRIRVVDEPKTTGSSCVDSAAGNEYVVKRVGLKYDGKEGVKLAGISTYCMWYEDIRLMEGADA